MTMRTGIACRRAGIACFLVTALAACGRASTLENHADIAFDRLAGTVPWSLAGPASGHGVCGDVVEREMCGPFVLRVEAASTEVVAGLPEVLRAAGFTHDVRTEGCDGCPQATTVLGEDDNGEELAVSVYAVDDEVTMLDAYLSAAMP